MVPDLNEREKWKGAMLSEVHSLKEKEVFEVASPARLDRRKIHRSKVVLKAKLGFNNELLKFKARFCACGYSQREGIDYEEFYAATLRLDTLRIVLSLAAKEGMYVSQADIETAFLYSRIDKEIYLDVSDKPLRALMNLQPGEVLKLNKAIYGLVQPPYLWGKKSRSPLGRLGCSWGSLVTPGGARSSLGELGRFV